MSFVTGTRTPARANAPLKPWRYYVSEQLTTGTSYAGVSMHDPETALQSIAVGSATDLLASLSSELPIGVYTGPKGKRVRKTTPGYLEDPAGDGYGLPDWIYQVVMSWLTRGNLYGDILENGRGYPTQIALHHPDAVNGYIDNDGVVQWSVDGKKISDPDRFLHNRVNPLAGRVLGQSPIQRHARSIGLNLTTAQFGLQWFQDGAHPSALLRNTEADLSDETLVRKVKDRYLAALRGTREPLVLGKGWEYKDIQVNAEESQFLATQGYTAADCCRIFGPGLAEVLGYESGGSMDYANVDSRLTHLLVLSLNKWLRRVDRLLTSMLPVGQYALIDRDGLMQSTTLDRYRAHAIARWKKINEIREDEELPPVEWGDVPLSGGSSSAEVDPQGGKSK